MIFFVFMPYWRRGATCVKRKIPKECSQTLLTESKKDIIFTKRIPNGGGM